MNNKKFTVTIALVAIALVAVVGIGVAAFTTTITVNGTGNVNSSSWEIKFQNLSAVTKTGTAKVITAPTLTSTHIGDYAVDFTTPGDSVSYTFEVINNGTFDAELSSISLGSPKCTGTGTTANTDATNVCKYVTYTLTYSNGTALATGDKLAAGAKKTLKLTLTYKDFTNAAHLPKNDVTISGLKSTLVFSQD